MKTLLIIDDDELCRQAAAAMLGDAGWQVLQARDGEEGIAMAIEHRPDAVLSDLLMSRGNGFAVCRALREVEALRHTQLFVMSGRDYPVDRENAAEAGAQHYFVKPLAYDEIKAVLKESATLDGDGARAPQTPPPLPAKDEPGTAVLRFWGVRGSIPTPGPTTVRYGGNTSCVELRADGEVIVMDAGTGIRPLGLALAKEFDGQPLTVTLVISHTHWDHIQGFPFFRPAYDSKNRIRILGYEGATKSLEGTLAGQMESPYFPIPLTKMPGHLQIEELRDLEFPIGPIRVSTTFSKHPGVCVGFRFHTSAGEVVYLPDNEWAEAESTAASEAEPCTQENVLLEFIRDADLVIMDSQYDQQEYESHRGWGHGCLDDVTRLAMLGNVKQLFLFHHDPEHDDDHIDRMLAHARDLVREAGSTLHVEAAREGHETVLRRAAVQA